jgi:hypothetical protein
MAGRRDELAALRARVDRLEQELERLHAATDMARPLLDDARRLADLADEARRCGDSAAAAVDTMRAMTAAAGIGQPRLSAQLNMIYQAKTTGYVWLFFVGGVTEPAEILVGTTRPPTQSVAKALSGTYAGTIVRAGEYWTARTNNKNAGYRCIFSPLL